MRHVVALVFLVGCGGVVSTGADVGHADTDGPSCGTSPDLAEPVRDLSPADLAQQPELADLAEAEPVDFAGCYAWKACTTTADCPGDLRCGAGHCWAVKGTPCNYCYRRCYPPSVVFCTAAGVCE